MNTEGKVKRNFENYSTRHEAYLAYKELCDSKKCPFWYEEDGVKAYFVVDFDEWIWLPVSDKPACPMSWKKEYLGIDRDV